MPDSDIFSCFLVSACESASVPASAATSARQSRQLARCVSARASAIPASAPDANSLAALSSRHSTQNALCAAATAGSTPTLTLERLHGSKHALFRLPRPSLETV